MTPTVQRFDRCIACGPSVISSYRTDGIAFLFRVFNEPQYLEKLTGLDVFQSTDIALSNFEYDTDSSI